MSEPTRNPCDTPLRVHHVIVWEFDQDSVTSRLECRAPKGAHCRLVGPDHCQCESWTVEHADSPMASPFHRVETYGGADIIHWMHDSGECSAVMWDIGDEESATPGQRFTIGEVPVTLSWEDPGYSWTRAEGDRG